MNSKQMRRQADRRRRKMGNDEILPPEPIGALTMMVLELEEHLKRWPADQQWTQERVDEAVDLVKRFEALEAPENSSAHQIFDTFAWGVTLSAGRLLDAAAADDEDEEGDTFNIVTLDSEDIC